MPYPHIIHQNSNTLPSSLQEGEIFLLNNGTGFGLYAYVNNAITKIGPCDGTTAEPGPGTPSVDLSSYLKMADAKLVVSNSSTGTSNAAATNGNVYLNLVAGSDHTNAHKIVGSGSTTVTSDATGAITIYSSGSGTGEGCECVDTEVTYTATTGTEYTIPTPTSPEEGVEYYYIIKNDGTNKLTIKYTSFSGSNKGQFEVPSGQIGEVSMLYFADATSSATKWVTRYAITSV